MPTPAISTGMIVVPLKCARAFGGAAPRRIGQSGVLAVLVVPIGGLGISVSASRATDHLRPGSRSRDVPLRQGLVGLGFQAQEATRVAPGRIRKMSQAGSAAPARAGAFLLTRCAAFLFIPAAFMLSGAKPGPSGGGNTERCAW